MFVEVFMRLSDDSHDFTSEFDTDILPMTEKFPDTTEKLQKHFCDYVAYAEHTRRGITATGSSASVPSSEFRKKQPLFLLQKDDDGYPLLPDESPLGEDLRMMKSLIRSYVTLHYRKCILRCWTVNSPKYRIGIRACDNKSSLGTNCESDIRLLTCKFPSYWI